VAEGQEDQGSFALSLSGYVPRYQPVDDRAFAAIRSRYDYPKEPLHAQVIEKVENPSWTREKVTYLSGGKRVIAYLYLPKGFARPLQVIHFSPGGDVEGGSRTLSASIEARLTPFIRGGRAVFSVVLEGFLERPHAQGSEEPDTRLQEYVDLTVTQVTEMRRGLDYLETRPDVDASRIAFVGFSAGAGSGVVVTALDPRYRSVLFGSSGIWMEEVADAAAANRINFAPRIAAPKLMLQGRYDEEAPLESSARPLFRLMREPKRLEIYEGGHALRPQIYIPVFNKWLDETVGPVSR
jgi:dienelactone hydrolase